MTQVIVPLADGCEEIEAVTIIDLLRRAEFEVTAAGLHAGPVTCSRGAVLVPDRELGDGAEEVCDVVALPGGTAGADRLAADARVLGLLEHQDAAGGWIGAICAAPGVLAAAGLLKGRRATAFPGALERRDHESTGAAVEIDGHIVTSRGPGTAINFALELIERAGSPARRDDVDAGLQR